MGCGVPDFLSVCCSPGLLVSNLLIPVSIQAGSWDDLAYKNEGLMENESELVDKVYDVAIDPNRYEDLVASWLDRLEETLNAPFTDPKLESHLVRAAQMLELMADRPAVDTASNSAEAESQPIISLNGAGKIVQCNPASVVAYQIQPGSELRELPFDSGTITVLQKHLNMPPKNMLVRGRRADTQASVLINVGASATHLSGVLTVRTAEVLWTEQLAAVLQESFGMTPSETDIVGLLIAGNTLTEVAAERSRSTATVRTQVRAIYSKTATTGLPELLRMVLSLATLFPVVDNASNDAPIARPTIDERYLFTLDDGRKLDYAMFGDPNGRPCLFLHDAFFCYSWMPTMVEQATKLGLRVIAPARQCWGNSDPYPAETSSHHQFSADVEALLSHLCVSGVVILARTLGAAYAYRIVANNPERYLGIVGVVPALPMGSKEDLEALPPHQRFLTKSVRHNKTLLGFLSRAGDSLYRRYGAKALLRMVYRGSAPDLQSIDDPQVFAAMAYGLELSESYGFGGFYRDFAGSPLASWADSLQLPVPMHALLGEFDTNQRLRRVERLQQRGEDIALTIVPGAAELLFYQKPDVVLSAVDNMFVDASNSRPRRSAL